MTFLKRLPEAPIYMVPVRWEYIDNCKVPLSIYSSEKGAIRMLHFNFYLIYGVTRISLTARLVEMHCLGSQNTVFTKFFSVVAK